MIRHWLQSVIFSGVLMASAPLAADLPQPYTNIHLLNYTPFYLDNAYLLDDLINTVSASTFIDISSNENAAARLVAQYHPSITNFAIDSWWSYDHARKNLFQRFLSNVIQENTADIIIPIRMTPLEAARSLNVVADVIYLETPSDTLQAQIIAWFSHLSSNGAICGQGLDDVTVEAAVALAAIELGTDVTMNGTFWYIQRGE